MGITCTLTANDKHSGAIERDLAHIRCVGLRSRSCPLSNKVQTACAASDRTWRFSIGTIVVDDTILRTKSITIGSNTVHS